MGKRSESAESKGATKSTRTIKATKSAPQRRLPPSPRVDASASFRRAIALKRRDRYEEALELLAAIAKPSFPEALHAKGDLEQRLGKSARIARASLREAVAGYERLARRVPAKTRPQVHFYRAGALALLGERKAALGALALAIVDPKYRKLARSEEDFAKLRDTKAMRDLLDAPPAGSRR